MQEIETPPLLEVVPTIKGTYCKALMVGFFVLINFTPLGVALWLWYTYNIWISIAFFLFLTLVSGIILSKMRVASIPPTQRELNYSTLAVVKWYLGKNICF